MSEQIEAYKHFGLLVIVLFWLSVLLILLRGGIKRAVSISRHVATHRKGYVFFGLSSILGQIGFFLFFSQWFVPALGLSKSFLYMMLVGMAGTVLALVVPDVDGLKHRLHGFGAWTMASIMLASNVALGLSNQLSLFTRSVCLISSVTMVVLLIVVRRNEESRKQYLIFQAAYFALFHIGILTLAYFR